MAAIAFADSETRSPISVTEVGAYRYAKNPETDVLVWGYALDDGPLKIWSPDWAWLDRNGHPDREPTDLLDHVADGGYFVAWNAFFDRWIWNEVMVKKYGWPPLKLEQVLCAQAQAEANNLPGALGKAADCLGTPHKKDPQGKRLINILSMGTRANWNPKENMTADRMGRFRVYGGGDVVTMRDIWATCRPLTLHEWHEYHVSERINDRGVAVDAEFAERARSYATAEFADINGELRRVTDNKRMSVTNHVLKARWLHGELWPDQELQEAVTKPPKKKDGPIRYSCDRPTRELVLDVLSDPDRAALFHVEHLEKIVEFLELIEAGNSAAVRKFTAIVNQQVAGRVHGQYSFNGAGQTGRFSSRGIQIHNIIRDPVEKGNPDRALDAIEDIIGGADPDFLVEKYRYPVSRLLARLIRPTFIAPEGKTLVWADWDQIEGRALPWLAMSPGAERKLDLYRNGIDTYRVAAMPIFGLERPEDATDAQRQVGKVAELALGFGGAVGAFAAMSRGYGVTVDREDAQRIVDAWRASNPWARAFWNDLWDAAMAAHKHPGEWYRAGRVHYLFHPTLMKGTLICKLPCGRWIVYPQFKRERVEYEDENGKTRTTMRTSFVKGFGGGFARVDLWYGVLAENVTQATAASMLREALSRLDDSNVIYTVLDTHDEIVGETDERKAREARVILERAMTTLPDWAEGLPLSVSVEIGPYYTK